jgi:ubiquinone/menaquinone biosynthesis C-methylase UbiE
MHPKGTIDIFAPAYTIPLGNESFDCTLCTDLLEHLEDPGEAIAECSRILTLWTRLPLKNSFHIFEYKREAWTLA